jgi:N-acetylmuramoyl-L-alanine amidase
VYMKQLLGLSIGLSALLIPMTARAESTSLQIAYPPTGHETATDRIFFIGSAPPSGSVLFNGQPINRSRAGHFAPSFPLQIGENNFTIRYQDQTRQIKIIRIANQSTIPAGQSFAKDSLSPALNITKQSGESVCFSAIALPQSTVAVKLGTQLIPLALQPASIELPGPLAVFTDRNQPLPAANTSKFAGCTRLANTDRNLELGKPEFQFTLNGKTTTQTGIGTITILAPSQLRIAKVITEAGVARTGASSDYSRLTPLPKGTQAAIIGQEGDWLQLDYGGWINRKETELLPAGTLPPQSIIRSIGHRQSPGHWEMVFPLQAAVPITLQPGSQSLALTLHNTTAQTDLIRLDDNPLISRLDWQQVAPGKAQYTFHFKKSQQWGYQVRYEGTSLILSFRKPPLVTGKSTRPLSGIKILLDPGHGGKESGATGPNGSFEKDVNLRVSLLVRAELLKLGATVVMTREDDREVPLADRAKMIDREAPAIALSIHYNSLPDDGNLEKTQGVATLWYNAPSHNLAVFMHNYIVQKLNRPSYGIFWDNLALTRPTSSPSVLLELGFIASPQELEWVTNPAEQQKLAKVIAQGVNAWFQKTKE